MTILPELEEQLVRAAGRLDEGSVGARWRRFGLGRLGGTVAIAAGVAVVVVVVVIASGGSRTQPAGPPAPAGPVTTPYVLPGLHGRVVAQIKLTSFDHRLKSPSGTAEILRNGKRYAVAIAASGISPNNGGSYAVWLLGAPSQESSRKSLLLGIVNASSNHRLRTARPLPANAFSYRRLWITLEPHAHRSATPYGVLVLEGPWAIDNHPASRPPAVCAPYLPCLPRATRNVQRADVDGDGRPDLIRLYGHRRSFTLKVVRASGGVLSTRVANDLGETPAVIRVRNVNDRPGAEIFIEEGGISSGSFAGVYTFDGRGLRRAGGFTYGGDSGQQYGFTCHRDNPSTIVQHQFLLEGPSMTGRWQETETTYVWEGATLRRAAKRTTQRYGIPPRGLTGVHC